MVSYKGLFLTISIFIEFVASQLSIFHSTLEKRKKQISKVIKFDFKQKNIITIATWYCELLI